MKIFLIGFMGSGKSTIGKKLAKELNIRFIDLDQEIETVSQCSISDIFKYLGEDHFRKTESEVLKSFLREEAFVMATGGGTPCYYDNMDFILKDGISVYIELDAKSIFNRLVKAKSIRPTIKGKTEDELMNFIEESLSKRKDIYERANYSINGLSVTADEIMSLLNKKD